jgi:hypothetical protein
VRGAAGTIRRIGGCRPGGVSLGGFPGVVGVGLVDRKDLFSSFKRCLTPVSHDLATLFE